MTRGDTGAVTAEFAVALPALLLVLAACVGGLRLAGEQVRLQDAAAIAARALARGDPAPDLAAAERATWTEGGLVCVSMSSTASWAPGLPAIELSADSCALADGR